MSRARNLVEQLLKEEPFKVGDWVSIKPGRYQSKQLGEVFLEEGGMGKIIAVDMPHSNTYVVQILDHAEQPVVSLTAEWVEKQPKGGRRGMLLILGPT